MAQKVNHEKNNCTHAENNKNINRLVNKNCNNNEPN